MFQRLFGAAALFLLTTAPAAAAPVTPADLMRHIEVLASDAYEGRLPGTEGERKTIAYIAGQLQARGLQPAGPDGSWYQPVPLVERKAAGQDVRWSAGGKAIPFDAADIALIGRDPAVGIEDAPVVFAGHGARMPERGIDQLAGARIEGAVALILYNSPEVPDFPSFSERVETLRAAGAAAVIGILPPGIPWQAVRSNYAAGSTRLEQEDLPPLLGVMPLHVAERLIAAARGDLARLLDEQPGSSFRSVTLPLRADLSAETEVRRYASYNVVGRIPGAAAGGESVLFLGHWDHLGLCRPEGAEDRICNGAVDNASGIAMLIEAAGRLASGPRQARDLVFLATTAEEMGLLGAEHYVAGPTVPLESIVAAVNMDTVAIHPAGKPVAVIGRGLAPLDAAVAAAIGEVGRTLDDDGEADAFIQRQDGWAFTRAGVPAIMIGGSFSDMALLGAFLSGKYHGPEDEIGPALLLDGAAEDADLLVALARRLADPADYQRPLSQ